MGQRENFFEPENREDRKKISKYEIGDLIEKQYQKVGGGVMINREHRRFFIYDKSKQRDKKGEYWVYDIFFPDTQDVFCHTRLIDAAIYKYIKIA